MNTRTNGQGSGFAERCDRPGSLSLTERRLTIRSSAANEVSPLQRRVRQRWSWLERVVVRGHDARLSNRPETEDRPRTVELWSVPHAKRATGLLSGGHLTGRRLVRKPLKHGLKEPDSAESSRVRSAAARSQSEDGGARVAGRRCAEGMDWCAVAMTLRKPMPLADTGHADRTLRRIAGPALKRGVRGASAGTPPLRETRKDVKHNVNPETGMDA